ADIDLGMVTIDNNVQTASVSGAVTDCNNQPVTNGFVTLNMDGRYLRASIRNGNYSISTIICTQEPVTATLAASDISGQQSSEEKPIILSVVASIVEPIIACCSLSDVYA